MKNKTTQVSTLNSGLTQELMARLSASLSRSIWPAAPPTDPPAEDKAAATVKRVFDSTQIAAAANMMASPVFPPSGHPIWGNPNNAISDPFLAAAFAAGQMGNAAYIPMEDARRKTNFVIAKRAWMVRETIKEDALSLVSMYAGARWRPKFALCSDNIRDTTMRGHPVFMRSSYAGVHAVKGWGAVSSDYIRYRERGSIVVFGEVALWGKIIEHEFGYRAEYAYPRSFAEVNRESVRWVLAALTAQYIEPIWGNP